MNIIFYDEQNGGVITCWKEAKTIPNVNDEVVLDNPMTKEKECWLVKERLVFEDKIRCYSLKISNYYSSHTEDEDNKFNL